MTVQPLSHIRFAFPALTPARPALRLIAYAAAAGRGTTFVFNAGGDVTEASLRFQLGLPADCGFYTAGFRAITFSAPAISTEAYALKVEAVMTGLAQTFSLQGSGYGFGLLSQLFQTGSPASKIHVAADFGRLPVQQDLLDLFSDAHIGIEKEVPDGWPAMTVEERLSHLLGQPLEAGRQIMAQQIGQSADAAPEIVPLLMAANSLSGLTKMALVLGATVEPGTKGGRGVQYLRFPAGPASKAWDLFSRILRGTVDGHPYGTAATMQRDGAGGNVTNDPARRLATVRRYILALFSPESSAEFQHLPESVRVLRREVPGLTSSDPAAGPAGGPSAPGRRPRDSKGESRFKGIIKSILEAHKRELTRAPRELSQAIDSLIKDHPQLFCEEILKIDSKKPLYGAVIRYVSVDALGLVLQSLPDGESKLALFMDIVRQKTSIAHKVGWPAVTKMFFVRGEGGPARRIAGEDLLTEFLAKAPRDFSEELIRTSQGRSASWIVQTWVRAFDQYHPEPEALWESLLNKWVAKNPAVIRGFLRVMSGSFESIPHLMSAWSLVMANESHDETLRTDLRTLQNAMSAEPVLVPEEDVEP